MTARLWTSHPAYQEKSAWCYNAIDKSTETEYAAKQHGPLCQLQVDDTLLVFLSSYTASSLLCSTYTLSSAVLKQHHAPSGVMEACSAGDTVSVLSGMLAVG